MNAIFSKVRKRGILLAALLLMGCLQLFAQTRTVKGEVTDAQNGEALIGATVTVEGEKGGTVTDFDGNFSLQVSSSAKKIKVSYIGYIDKILTISAYWSSVHGLATGQISVLHLRPSSYGWNGFHTLLP